VPLSIDRSISRCRLILATFFFFGPFAGSVVVVVAAGGVVVVAAGAAAGVPVSGVPVAGAAVVGVPVAGAAVAGAPVIVSVPVFGVFWASTTPAGQDNNVTAARVAAIQNVFMRKLQCYPTAMR
jgi:NADH:ubiquinone oxidoreductase subunit 6 (subunit J)